MFSPAVKRRKREYQRMQRNFRYVLSRTLKWAVLSYGFISVYDALYGSVPTLVYRLGMTLAVLCGGLAALSIAFYVCVKVAEIVTTWKYRRRSENYG